MVQRIPDREDSTMAHTKYRCPECGWWDLAMKYARPPKCTQCGAKLEKPAIVPVPRRQNKRSKVA
jgi:predicted RNA-binding Zn-ribbon protein involved in translation (DUF1610 family)